MSADQKNEPGHAGQPPRGDEHEIDPTTGREKPRMRTEDMPSYTPQGRDEPVDGEIAEKAADIILGNTPLPPAKVEFYRHEVKGSA